MNILWCGGEDIDYPNGAGTVFVSTSVRFRSAYARSAILNNNATVANFLTSPTFPGGALTSAWLSFQVNTNSVTTSKMYCGVGLGGTSKGLFVGIDTSTAGKIAISKYDGTTRTQLAAESGASLSNSTQYRFDVQVISYGASATVNVYLNSTLVVTYTGDVTVSGMSNFNAVSIPGGQGGYISEVVVSDSDTRPLVGVQTLALTGAGATADWTNSTYTNINGTTISDASPASSNANNQVQDYNVTNAVSGTYTPIMVKISARMAKSATPAVSQVQLGYNNGSGSSGAGTGATKAVTTSYANYEQFDATNPITGSAWQQSQLDALQIELTAKT